MTSLVLAFDYGERRIGIATANPLTATATPLTTVLVRNGIPDWVAIDHCIADWAPAELIVGQPPKRDNKKVLAAIANFVQELQNRYKLPVNTVDESLTSRAAEAMLAAQRRGGIRKKRTRKGDIDKHAACFIAERWMAETKQNG